MAVLDSLVILSTALICYHVTDAHFGDVNYYAAAIAFVWLISILLMNFAGLYEFDPIMRPLAASDRIVIAFMTTFFFLMAAAFSLKISKEYSRIWTGSFALSVIAATLFVRIFAARIMAHLADLHVFSRNVVILGSGEQAQRLLAQFDKSPPRFISVLGIFKESSQSDEVVKTHKFLGTFNDLPAYIRDNDVDDVIVCLPWSADHLITRIMGKLSELPVNVYLGADLIGFRLPIRPAPAHFGELPLTEVMGRPLAGWGGLQKSVLDYSLGVILTVLLLPIMVIIVMAIKFESKGPALFRQERYGFVNRIFTIYKFRTMYYSDVPEAKIVQATRDDPRITRIGRFLRRTSLDELPQLFNVMNGTMSLVGPRPHAVEHNEEYAQIIRGYFARHRVKPGMTGWAQVNGCRGETKTVDDMETRVRFDISYVENWSLLFDLRILAMSLIICLTGRNAY